MSVPVYFLCSYLISLLYYIFLIHIDMHTLYMCLRVYGGIVIYCLNEDPWASCVRTYTHNNIYDYIYIYIYIYSHQYIYIYIYIHTSYIIVNIYSDMNV